MSASDEIYGKVVRVLVEALNVDEDGVTPTATLQGDLGAESIDFLDIVFRLEREFGISPRPLVPPRFLKVAVCAPDTTTIAGIPGGDSVSCVAQSWGNGAVLEVAFPTKVAL